ncbi:BRO-N domain-containing protein [Clostridium beijerinckii]|uniref:Prophage antirepressor-like protein n=1 Tax=Clostridium beijerinckii TaxID=1520 RepID=A0A9Q5CIC4_CLOBE|nr:BRO family protein [Clostridium beijerinckii]AQS04172.1 hypothetical protein CLBIJ_15910 [Clostridium beijerinckii]MBA2883939.1 prophage antirepressor-like protein [Clostridium beijerinckii]MBA2899124.1 prophage antirepressor-like protein [Clostridium beijerinckii]MBA2908524.1 prophage antirepressor-like protein [Clostridium beijerinckii]MBA9016277.1 prophage antirepressor-like protein [Clostridium beijerinckii]
MYAFSTGSLAITYEGIQEYCKRSRYRKTIDFDKLLEELNPIENTDSFKQQEFKETKNTNNSNGMQTFCNFEFGNVRLFEVGSKPYFVGIDVARSLGYKNPSKAIIDHCKGITKLGIPSSGGIQETNVIPEGDIYRLIVNSKLPSVVKFERWVFDEILPTIRKTGGYVNNAKQFRNK